MKFCPQCGAPLPPTARFCIECGAKIPIESHQHPQDRITGATVNIRGAAIDGNIDASTHVSSHIDSQTNIGGDVNIHMGAQEPSAQEIFEKALTALQLKNYPLAVQLFEKYTAMNPTDAEGYYYLALTSFHGSRPKMAKLSTIRTIEGHLRTAAGLDPACSPAFLLWAIVKQDYYAANSMRITPPPISELISHVHSIDKKHAREIITHLPAPRNEIWDWLHSDF
jgi:hypothetical protein